MPDLSEVEYDALEEYWTLTTPAVLGGKKKGLFIQNKGKINLVNEDSPDYIRTLKAEEDPPEFLEEV